MSQIRVNAMSFAIMVRSLCDGPKTVHQIAEASGLRVWTVRHYVKSLHKQEVVHIHGWVPDSMGRDATVIYAWGMGIDVPRRLTTGAEKMRQRRKRAREAAEEANRTL